MFICDTCTVKRIETEKIKPHFQVFGEMVRYTVCICDECNKEEECIFRNDLQPKNKETK